ncbi:hypothetical protein ACI3PL_27580, partial [Lacticaseibacillus paracasei]
EELNIAFIKSYQNISSYINLLSSNVDINKKDDNPLPVKIELDITREYQPHARVNTSITNKVYINSFRWLLVHGNIESRSDYV